MPPQEIVAFLREFGVPLTILAVFGGLIIRGILVTGKSADVRVMEVKAAGDIERAEMKARYDAQLEAASQEKAYREERRIEERANRLLTEEALRNQVGVMRDMTELLKDIERNFRGLK